MILKRTIPIILIFGILFSFSGCSVWGRKTVKIEESKAIDLIPQNRINELMSANYEIIKSIHHQSSFFTLAELEDYAINFYTKETIDRYFNKKIFFEKDGKIQSNIKMPIQLDVKTLKLTPVSNSTYIKNDEQYFKVIFEDNKNSYIKDFSAMLDENGVWLLMDIFI